MTRTSFFGRPDTILAALIAAIASSILAGSVAVSWAVANGASTKLRWIFRIFCHQIPERCFVLFGQPMPICARCSGIYAGLLAGVVIYLVLFTRREFPSVIAIALAMPLVIDGVIQAVGVHPSTNSVRLMTGILAGIATAVWPLSRTPSTLPVEVKIEN